MPDILRYALTLDLNSDPVLTGICTRTTLIAGGVLHIENEVDGTVLLVTPGFWATCSTEKLPSRADEVKP